MPSLPAAPDARPRWTGFVPAFALILAVLAAYSNTFDVPFLLDDTAAIVENPTLRRLWPPGAVLSPPANAGVGGRPVANLTFALNFAAGGLDVRGYHGVNLAIHLSAALVLFGLVRRTLELPLVRPWVAQTGTSSVRLAWGVALVWALHPLQTEAVTYLSQRTESLMGFFYLATLYCLVRSAPTASIGWRGLGVLMSLAGIATKEVMVTVPVLALLLDRTFIAGSFRAAWQARRRFHLALMATWIPLLFLLADVHERGVGHAAVAWWEYALTSTRSIIVYLQLALWPAPLVFDYGTDVVRRVVEVWPQLLLLAALVGATGFALWRRPRAGFLGAWVFCLLAPATSIVPVAGQTMAEHRMYLPLAAVVAGLVGLAHRALGPRASLITVAAAILLGGATFARNRDYRDAVTLWTETVKQRPQNARAHAALGAALLEQGRLAPAVASLESSLRLDPNSSEAHNNLATALQDLNRPQDAITHYAAALRLRPGIASTHYNFGNALLGLGRTPEAIAQQRQALILQPHFPEALCALAHALAANRQPDEAIAQYRAALALRPGLTPAHFGLANVLASTGRGPEAIPHYEATLRAVPTSAEAHFNLGVVLAQSQQISAAIAHFEKALELQPDFAAARQNLEALRRPAPR